APETAALLCSQSAKVRAGAAFHPTFRNPPGPPRQGPPGRAGRSPCLPGRGGPGGCALVGSGLAGLARGLEIGAGSASPAPVGAGRVGQRKKGRRRVAPPLRQTRTVAAPPAAQAPRRLHSVTRLPRCEKRTQVMWWRISSSPRPLGFARFSAAVGSGSP